MARKQYTPLSDEQLVWLRRWGGERTVTLKRVLLGMEKRGLDAGEPTYRRTHAAMLELQALATGRPPVGIWAAPRWTGKPPDPFSPEQVEYLRGVIADATRDLQRVTDYFDAAGAPDKQTSEAIRAAAHGVGAIAVHLQYLNCQGACGEFPEPVAPSDPAIDCGAGI